MQTRQPTKDMIKKNYKVNIPRAYAVGGTGWARKTALNSHLAFRNLFSRSGRSALELPGKQQEDTLPAKSLAGQRGAALLKCETAASRPCSQEASSNSNSALCFWTQLYLGVTSSRSAAIQGDQWEQIGSCGSAACQLVTHYNTLPIKSDI